MLGESGEAKEGIFIVPGDPTYNFIKLSALYVKMSKLQRNSLMAGDAGTHEFLIKTNEHALSEMLQTELLLSRRGNANDSEEGMVYSGNGLVAQIQSNVLSAGSAGNTLAFGELSDFVDGTFESANTSATKTIVSGERAYMNFLNTARQEGVLADVPHYNPALGVDEFMLTTGGGKNVTISKHRFAMQGELADSALVLDLGNLETGEFAGFEGWKWSLGLDDNSLQGMTVGTDAIMGSMMVAVIDPDTCGYIKGEVTPRLKNRNGLGIVG